LDFLGSISSTFHVQLLRTCGAQKRKKDSQVVSLFTLSGSVRAKACKYVGEIDPWCLQSYNKRKEEKKRKQTLRRCRVRDGICTILTAEK